MRWKLLVLVSQLSCTVGPRLFSRQRACRLPHKVFLSGMVEAAIDTTRATPSRPSDARLPTAHSGPLHAGSCTEAVIALGIRCPWPARSLLGWCYRCAQGGHAATEPPHHIVERICTMDGCCKHNLLALAALSAASRRVQLTDLKPSGCCSQQTPHSCPHAASWIRHSKWRWVSNLHQSD